MDRQIKRGRTLLLLLLSAVCLIFWVNVFYPLYPGSLESSNRRITSFFLMLTFAALTYNGVCDMRAPISGVLFILALVDSLILFYALADGRLGLFLAIGSFIFVHALIGWLLLTSESIRAFEAARQQRTAKI